MSTHGVAVIPLLDTAASHFTARWQPHFNPPPQVVASTSAKHAYVVSGRTFITCDTPATLQMKIDAAAALGLGGLMVRLWAVWNRSSTQLQFGVALRHTKRLVTAACRCGNTAWMMPKTR